MSGWILESRGPAGEAVDASPLRVAELVSVTARELESTPLWCGVEHRAVADLFRVKRMEATEPTLVLAGDLSRFDYVGGFHEVGRLVVDGSAGDHCGAGMRGGTLDVRGNVGDFAAGPVGSRRSGMRGGRLIVRGSAGRYTGHRMRRGDLHVEGDSGPLTACAQVAGTIVVAGRLGGEPACAMRRGTLIVPRQPPLSPERFSDPRPLRSVFLTLLWRDAASQPDPPEKTTRLLERLAAGPVDSMRGDRAVGGLGEILSPAQAQS